MKVVYFGLAAVGMEEAATYILNKKKINEWLTDDDDGGNSDLSGKEKGSKRWLLHSSMQRMMYQAHKQLISCLNSKNGNFTEGKNVFPLFILRHPLHPNTYHEAKI